MGRFDLRTRNGLIYPIMQGISPVSPILDLYPTAQAAYSLRLLNSSYTGSAIRVRRSSDNAEQNIGFIDIDLNTTELLNFVGAGNGFVSIWYDQSGNLKNASQTTAANQPQIVTSGVLETQLGRPALKFLRVNNHGLITSVTINNPFSIIGVVSQDFTTVTNTRIFNSSSASPNSIISLRRSDGLLVYNNTLILSSWNSAINNRPYLLSFLRQTSTSFIYQDNQVVPNSSTQSANWGGFQMSTPTHSTAEPFAGKISEAIIYPVNQNSNISGIHSNINTYYSIY